MELKIIICIIVLTLCTSNIIQCVAPAVNRRPSRNVNDLTKTNRGPDFPIGDYPYIVSLQLTIIHFCGGSLIHPLGVLTTANCVCSYAMNPSDLTVLAGLSDFNFLDLQEYNLNRRRVVEIICHEAYSGIQNGVRANWNDIAIVTLESIFGEELSVKVVALPPPDFVEPVTCVTIGWGVQFKGKVDPLSRMYIHAADIILTDMSYCAKKEFKTVLLEDYQLCADTRNISTTAGSGICTRGGPLVKDGVQLGITSYVESNYKGCSGNPYMVFTRVAKYHDWIAKHLAELVVPKFGDKPQRYDNMKNKAGRTCHREQTFMYLFMFMYVLLV